MRIGVVGAGGVGGLVAGLLARAGHDVALVARGETLASIRARGLHIDSPLGVFDARVDAGSVETLAPVDALFVAVKTWQVPEVAATRRPMLAPNTVVVPLQNGVDAVDQCADALGEDHVFGGIAYVLSWIVASGSIKHIGDAPHITLGPWRRPVDDRLEALTGLLAQAGLCSRIVADFAPALWDKFLFIASFGGVGAVARVGAGALRSVPETRNMLVGAFEEVRQVSAAKGVVLQASAVANALACVDKLPEDATTSLQRDIVGARPSEIDALSGAVVRIGRATGVPVPIHSAIYASLLPQDRAARRI